MSLTDEQKAIAKVQAQGCRRWMSVIILAPVLLCVILTLLAPNISNYLAQREATEQCQILSSHSEVVTNSTIYDDNTFESDTVISADNLEQMVLLGETTLNAPISSRSYIPAIAHPNGNYTIYALYRPSEATNFYICANGEALGAFSADETAGDIVFNADGSLFAVSDGRNGRVLVFDAVNIERLEIISIADIQESPNIESLTFHPTESLLFFTSEDELFVYDTDDFQQQLRLPIFETQGHEISFDAEGTRFYMVHTENNATAYTWGIQD